MKIVALDSGQWDEAAKNNLSKAEVVKIVKDSSAKAAELLPTLSQHTNIVVRQNRNNCLKETGDHGFAYDSELLIVQFDPRLPYGKETFIKNFSNTVLHECNHAARYAWLFSQRVFEPTIMYAGIHEGLATAFERDYGSADPLYGEYKDDTTMRKWLRELRQADKNGESWKEWGFTRKDGRRWVGYKVGTWIVDRAKEKSNKNVIELTTILSKDILKLAEL